MQLLQGRELWRCRQLRRGLSGKVCLASLKSITHFNIKVLYHMRILLNISYYKLPLSGWLSIYSSRQFPFYNNGDSVIYNIAFFNIIWYFPIHGKDDSFSSLLDECATIFNNWGAWCPNISNLASKHKRQALSFNTNNRRRERWEAASIPHVRPLQEVL